LILRIALAVVAVLTGLIGAAVVASIAGTSTWTRATQAAVDALASSPAAPAAQRLFLHQSTNALPPPVARYLRAAVTDIHPIVRSAIATQEAEFFINGAWRPLRATQHFTVAPPGFVWDARISMAPLLDVSVRDAYVLGRGAMQASLLGVYALADQADTPALNAGALQRFLGEAIWFPTALLPSAAVTWAPRDERSAVATLRDGATAVSLAFEFADGKVRTISGDRFRESRGRYTLEPWRIECGEHAEREGMTIPLRCEVSWITNGRAEPYWRGRITAIAYRYN
jgi:hypothetical protein